jgi:homogentisate 1,2-dioxygenase
MAFYVKQGDVPGKRHVVFKPKGDHTYEELISRQGFADVSSNVYHIYPPSTVVAMGETEALPIELLANATHRNRHLKTFALPTGGDWLHGRRVLATNNDINVVTCEPDENVDWFYRNAMADELVFVHHGTGTLETMFGDLAFGPGDYVVIPRSVIHRWRFDAGRAKLLIVEAAGPVETPKHFRNQWGQLMEHAPYCERDLRVPVLGDPIDERGEFTVKIKVGEKLQTTVLGHHPFDVLGWDGFYYPWIFNINDFMPIVGKVHLPPPVHVTFTGPGFVICSFVPRLFDFHDDAIPIPYAHSNVDSDEILYYVEGNFMSRRGIESESMTLHPMGYPHGPQPGLLEPSLGAKDTAELAVMIDTFAPLNLTRDAGTADDSDYPLSWATGDDQ